MRPRIDPQKSWYSQGHMVSSHIHDAFVQTPELMNKLYINCGDYGSFFTAT